MCYESSKNSVFSHFFDVDAKSEFWTPLITHNLFSKRSSSRMHKTAHLQLSKIYIWLKFCGDLTSRSGENRKIRLKNPLLTKKRHFFWRGKCLTTKGSKTAHFREKFYKISILVLHLVSNIFYFQTDPM